MKIRLIARRLAGPLASAGTLFPERVFESSMRGFLATAWNNGSHHKTGAGYGLRISPTDRDRHFSRSWKTVTLILGDKPVRVNVAKKSFWNETCRELISAEVGRWLLAQGAAPWPEGRPPRVRLEPMDGAVFLTRLDNASARRSESESRAKANPRPGKPHRGGRSRGSIQESKRSEGQKPVRWRYARWYPTARHPLGHEAGAPEDKWEDALAEWAKQLGPPFKTWTIEKG